MRLGNQKLADECFLLAMNENREGLSKLITKGFRASIYGNFKEGIEACHKFEEAIILDC